VQYVVGAIAIFFLGFAVGKRYHNQEIDDKLILLNQVAEDVRRKNNHMVDTLGELYKCSSNYRDGEFTDMDAILMDMWME